MSNKQIAVWGQKKQCSTVICQGMIGYNYKRLCHVWVPESKEQHEASEAKTKQLNTAIETQENELNESWNRCPEWMVLKEQELTATKTQQAKKKASASKKTPHKHGEQKDFGLRKYSSDLLKVKQIPTATSMSCIGLFCDQNASTCWKLTQRFP